jgi:hypothetical protein
MICAVLGLYTTSCRLNRCPEIGTNSIDLPQLNRFSLKTETEFNLGNFMF